MKIKNANIFYDNFQIIEALFQEENSISLEERINIMEKMCKYMFDSYQTQKMKILYEFFTKEANKNFYAKKMLEEYMNYVRELLGKINLKSENIKNKKINENQIDETYRWLKHKLPDFDKIDLKSSNALIYGQVQSGKTENIFGIALMHILTG